MRPKVAACTLLAGRKSKEIALALAGSTFLPQSIVGQFDHSGSKEHGPSIRVKMDEDQNVDLVNLTADIVASHVANNNLSAAELPALIKTT